jgi:hypothetical protein
MCLKYFLINLDNFLHIKLIIEINQLYYKLKHLQFQKIYTTFDYNNQNFK